MSAMQNMHIVVLQVQYLKIFLRLYSYNIAKYFVAKKAEAISQPEMPQAARPELY